MEMLDKLRLPIGSLVVDASLVLFVTFTAGRLVDRLEALDRRMLAVETREVTPGADRRLSVLEAENRAREQQIETLRGDMLNRFDRLDKKLDSLYKHE